MIGRLDGSDEVLAIELLSWKKRHARDTLASDAGCRGVRCLRGARWRKRYAIGLTAHKRYLPEFRLFQMFVKDPNGLTIELNFHGIEAEPSWGAGSENYADMPRAAR